MRNRLKLIRSLFAAILCVMFLSQAQAHALRPKLTENQLEHLVKIKAPDHLIASQIESRGLSFDVTYAIVKEFSNEGAGPQTLYALRRLVRVGTIVVHAQPASAVMIDDRYVGMTNPVGILMVQDVTTGPHTVTVSKEGFQGGHRQVIVANGQLQQVSIPMQWSGGDLSIEVNPSNASVSVTGPRSFTGARANVPCPQGSYTITVAAKGYLTQTRDVDISSGSNVRVNIELAADPAYVADELASARRFLAAGSVQRAAEQAQTVLALSPDNSFAETILAHAAYQEGDEQDFVRQTLQIIHDGGKVTITMMHLHAFPMLKILPVSMILSAKGVAFSESVQKGRKDKIPAFIAYSDVVRSTVIRPQNGGPEINIVWVAAHHNHFMPIEHTIDLVAGGSEVLTDPGTILSIGGGGETIRSPAYAWQQLSGINYLFQHLR